MKDTEKRYSQTEKDALAVGWAGNRFSMYLLGAPKFKIIIQRTNHSSPFSTNQLQDFHQGLKMKDVD